ncbi:MAG: acyltransferase [Sphingomonadales bacterium]|nr:MAG: acyltransferase [Sphingomonadales bacterium]
MIVLFHIRDAMPWLPHGVMAVLSHGYLAVDFFFLLSGFVIWNSYTDRIRSGGAAALPDFFKRRIARIWPLHIFMLGVGLAIALLLNAAGRDTHDFPMSELPLHVLLLQNWGFTSHLSWNDPAWSISCELAAYLLFPLLAFAIDWRRVPTLAILAAIAALLSLLHTIFATRGLTQLGQELTQLGVIRCVLEFACGTAIGALWLRWRESGKAPAILSAALALLFAAAAITGTMPETFAAPAAFAAALLALALVRNSLLEAAPLHYLGEISYATYLGHYLLWFAFKLAFVDDPHNVPLPLLALFLMLVLASSVALYHLVEKPAQRAINSWKIPRRNPATI